MSVFFCHHHAGGDWFRSLVPALSRGLVWYWGGDPAVVRSLANGRAVAGFSSEEAYHAPGLYLPTVANNFISAMAPAARFGYTDAGLVFLGAGVFSWLSLEPVILQRLRSSGELPAVLRTSLGILNWLRRWWPCAPGSASTVAKAMLAKMLFGYGLLQLLFMLRLMPWYLSQPFNASFWLFVRRLGAGNDGAAFRPRQRVRFFSYAGDPAVYLPIYHLRYY